MEITLVSSDGTTDCESQRVTDVFTPLIAFFGPASDGPAVATTPLVVTWWHWFGIVIPITLVAAVLYDISRQHGWINDETLDRIFRKLERTSGEERIGTDDVSVEKTDIKEDEGGSDIGGNTEARDDVESTGIDSIAVLLRSANERKEQGDTDQAVDRAYTAVRMFLANHVDKSAQTPREFYEVCRTNEFSEEEIEALRQVTERYEKAAFATTGTSDDDAKAAIDNAKRIVDQRA